MVTVPSPLFFTACALAVVSTVPPEIFIFPPAALTIASDTLVFTVPDVIFIVPVETFDIANLSVPVFSIFAPDTCTVPPLLFTITEFVACCFIVPPVKFINPVPSLHNVTDVVLSIVPLVTFTAGDDAVSSVPVL